MYVYVLFFFYSFMSILLLIIIIIIIISRGMWGRMGQEEGWDSERF